jgi:hypothetical protein
VTPLEMDETETSEMHNDTPATDADGSHNIANRGDIEMPFEPDNIPLETLLANHIRERHPEEIILEGQPKVINREVKGTREVIIHFDDGSNKSMDTEDIYNHMEQDYKCEEIEEFVDPKYSDETGKLYILIRWRDGHESLIDAEIIRKDDPV